MCYILNELHFKRTEREQVDNVSSLQVSDAAIQPSPTIKTLGVTLDRLRSHSTNMWPTCAKPVTSIYERCPTCTSLFLMTLLESLPVALSTLGSITATGMTDRNFKKLQRVQNTLARVVLRAGKFEHITPALIQLH